jgi:hypothetical protein
MKLAQSVRVGAWFLIGVNLLMSLGAIWVFRRMAPVIEVVIERNDRSLQACEEMLFALGSLTGAETENGEAKETFANALMRAEGNITETEEPAIIGTIKWNSEAAFLGDIVARKNTMASIMKLAHVNRTAMIRTNRRAQQFGNAGAWVVVFMATGSFFIGMLFVRSLGSSVVKPFEEINEVITAFRKGDRLRRCSGADLSKDTAVVYRNLNELLDMFPMGPDCETVLPDPSGKMTNAGDGFTVTVVP